MYISYLHFLVIGSQIASTVCNSLPVPGWRTVSPKPKQMRKNDKAADLRSLKSRQSYNPTQITVTVPRVTLLSHPGKE